MQDFDAKSGASGAKTFCQTQTVYSWDTRFWAVFEERGSFKSKDEIIFYDDEVLKAFCVLWFLLLLRYSKCYGKVHVLFLRDNCLVSRCNSHRVTANLIRCSSGRLLAFQPTASVYEPEPMR